MARTIQIRNVPDDVHRTLRTQAATAGMSLSDFLLEEVTLVSKRSLMAEVLRRADARPGGVTDSKAIVEVIRQMRESR